MHIRTAFVGAGIAALAVGGLSAPAQAAPQAAAGTQSSWTYVAGYWSESACVDAGQQYEREGWSYECRYSALWSPPYDLYIQ